METLRLRVDADHMDDPESEQALEAAATLLKRGGLVALPTETVYGLGANALDPVAVAGIFRAKGRPGWDPLIVHVADETMLAQVVSEVPDAARQLMRAFWPGPLTLLLRRSETVPDAVTAGRALVGVRMPAHRVALELIRRAGVPIAAPSANRFGHTSPTTAEHVFDDLDGRIDAVVDAGPTLFGVESTVVDATSVPMMIYRPGAVTVEQIRAVVSAAEVYVERAGLADEPREAMPSPGVGLRHYAPKARLILVEDGAVKGRLGDLALDFLGQRVGLMLPTGWARLSGAGYEIFDWGRWPDAGEEPSELAQRLFAGLRWLDARGCAVILCPVPQGEGLGAAIRDRLRKAAWVNDIDP